MPNKEWDEIIYPYPNFNGAAVEVFEWIYVIYLRLSWAFDYLSMLGIKINPCKEKQPLVDYPHQGPVMQKHLYMVTSLCMGGRPDSEPTQDAPYLVSHSTHWGRDKMATLFQATFSNAFSWMKMCKFLLRFRKFVPMGPVNNIPSFVQIMVWRLPGDNPSSEPMMASLLMHIWATPFQCIKLWGVYAG